MYEPTDDILRQTNEAALQKAFPPMFMPLPGTWAVAFARVVQPAVARLEELYPSQQFLRESGEHEVPQTNQTVFFYNLLDSSGNHIWDCTIVTAKKAPVVFEAKQLLFQWHSVFFEQTSEQTFEQTAEGGVSC